MTITITEWEGFWVAQTSRDGEDQVGFFTAYSEAEAWRWVVKTLEAIARFEHGHVTGYIGNRSTRGNGWCRCGARLSAYYVDGGRLHEGCTNGGHWVTDLPPAA